MKTQVYSWRLSRELKSELERAARLRRTSLSGVLEQAARAWLAQNSAELAEDAETQRKLHAAAARYIGCIAGDNPYRSERAKELVQMKVRRKYGR
jgi:predicted transcriptional regulator